MYIPRRIIWFWLVFVCALTFASVTLAQEDNPATNGAGLIAFQLYSPEGTGIYTMNTDGTNPQRITEVGVSSANPVWSPDGTQIAFSTYGGYAQVNVMDADGSNSHVITSGDHDNIIASWFPDGLQLLYTSSYNRGQVAGTLNVINIDGTNVRQIFDDPDGRNFGYTLSPDGTKIAFVMFQDFTASLFVMNADGTNPQQLSDGSVSLSTTETSAWSPDSSRIAFGAEGDIYVINADGSDQHRITDSDTFDYSPTWSPDGTQIAFASQEGAAAEIYVMNADGSDVQQLTSGNLEGNPMKLAWQPNANVTVAAVPTPRPTPTPEETEEAEVESDDDENVLFGFLDDDEAEGSSIAYGETVEAELDGEPQEWTFEGAEGDVVTIEMNSDDFDTYLELHDSDGDVLTYNDDFNNLNSQIDEFELPDNDTYTIIARGYRTDAEGDYTLSLELEEQSSAEADDSSSNDDTLAYGDEVEGSLRDGNPDEWTFEGAEGDVVTIAMSSDDFDTYLELHDSDGDVLTYNDDFNNLNSQIDGFELPDDDTYTIIARGYRTDAEGDYVLSLEQDN